MEGPRKVLELLHSHGVPFGVHADLQRVPETFRHTKISLAADSAGYKPEIQAFPSNVVKKGDSVTIRCSFRHEGQFRLESPESRQWYEDGNINVKEQNFTVQPVYTKYICRSLTGNNWTHHSDVLTLKVIEPHKPSISACLQGHSEDNHVLITCTAPDPAEECRVKQFFMHKGELLRRTDKKNIESSQVTFTDTDITAEYRCSYVLQVRERPLHRIESPFSDGVTPTTCEGFYTLMFIRHIISALILILLGVILLQHFRHKDEKPDLPPA